MDSRTWTDEDLTRAIRESTSWRGVLRSLGLRGMSQRGVDGIKKHAERLGLDTAHIHGQIKYAWPREVLADAIADSGDWDELASRLGFASNHRFREKVRMYADDAGLSIGHIKRPSTRGTLAPTWVREPLLPESLRVVAPLIASVWFAVQGWRVAVPQEPAPYDLLVALPDQIARVQVKSTTCELGGKWLVGVGRRPYTLDKTAGKAPYGPDLFDYFFILNSEGTMYVIPAEVAADKKNLYLSAYEAYIVGNVSTLLKAA